MLNPRTFALLLMLAGCQTVSSPALPPSTTPTPPANIEYRTYSSSGKTIYTLRVPATSGYEVVPVVTTGVQPLEGFAQQKGAIAAINGGFFDPENQQTTSYITSEGKLVADPRQNARLTNNPNLAPYLNQILNRSELRRYQCDQIQYAIALHRDSIPAGCQLTDALGAGPRLLPKLTAIAEGFVAESNGVLIRDSLGSNQPNARSAVGITQDGSIILVMAAQKSDTTGITLTELATFLKTLGAKQAINLDGGSSTSFYYRGQVIYGKVDLAGKRVKRSIKSALLVLPHTAQQRE